MADLRALPTWAKILLACALCLALASVVALVARAFS